MPDLISDDGRPAYSADPGSFRDRSNVVYDDGQHILRGISGGALANWQVLSSAPFFSKLMESGKVVTTKLRENFSGESIGDWAAYLEHERIPFISYPYEWSFGMLRDAALLQLELVEAALQNGWTMVDATAYNVQWIGCRPVFIDIPSFVPYVPGEPWVGYRQFCMMYLYPLMLQSYKGIDFQRLLRSDLEGIDPHVANRLLSGLTRFRKGVVSHVYLHSKLQNKYAEADLDEAKSLKEDAGGAVSARKKIHHSEAMVLGLVQGLRRTVAAFHPDGRRTTWGNYDTEHSYGEASFQEKAAFVEKAAARQRRKLVWDLGCNTGTFSKICAKHSDYVVSVDGDPRAIDRLYEGTKRQGNEPLLPMIMNLANMSPGQGWGGRERKPFDGRGKPDLVLCLALIHHIVISANIPLVRFVEWLRKLDAEVVIEFVSANDDMARMLLRNKENQYSEMTEDGFESTIKPMFEIISSQPVKRGFRKLYHLAPR